MTFPRRNLVLAAACLASLTASAVFAQDPDLTYHTVTPCLVLDTRVAGGAFAANETRTYNIVGTASLASQGGSTTGCGIPGFSNSIPQVQAVAVNVVVITPGGAGHLQAYPADITTSTSVINYSAGVTIANTTHMAVAQTSGVGDFKVKANVSTAHVLVSVVGYYSKAVQTVFVHPVPGDDTESGTRLLNALAGITNASATKRYVIKVEPGIYGLGSTSLLMKPYVDIEGSGQDATVIKGNGSSDSALTTAVVEGADSAELRNLQVYCDGDQYTYTYGIAIYNDAVSPRIKDVKIVSTKNVRSWGIRNASVSSPTIEDVRIEAEGSTRAYGISNSNSGTEPTIKRVVIQASGGTSENYGIANFVSARPAEVRDVQITVAGGSGSLAYGIYVPSSTTNPLRITNTAISVSGGTTIQGIHSDGATAEVEQSQIRASGSGSNGINSVGTVRVYHSLIAGVGSTVTALTAMIGTTHLDGGAVSATSATCSGVSDESFTFYASTCP
jgi:hypothetical protein